MQSPHAWNSIGHKIVAKIAYDNMSDSARERFSDLNAKLNKIYKPADWETAAVWLDTLRYQDINWFNAIHYIDIPFTFDGTALPTLNPINAVWGINSATATLKNKYASIYDKGIALRILIHITADVHQPLHAATEVSKNLPNGDKGGNLYILYDNPIAKNLHEYWDKGAGLLNKNKYRDPEKISSLTNKLEKKWPCQTEMLTSYEKWAKESHEIAVQDAYKLPINNAYVLKAQNIVKQRLALAGCRLGLLLNKLDDEYF